MKVRMRTSVAGRTFTHRRGDVVEVAAETAEGWERNGLAERVPTTSSEAPKKIAARRPVTKKLGST